MTAVDHITIALKRADLLSSEAEGLMAALNAELAARYPEEGAGHLRLDPGAVSPAPGRFVIATAGGRPVGCGSIWRLDEQSAEIKRMYVAPEQRGRGVGRAILGALVAEGRALGVERLLLETGLRQPEAIALYEGAGFLRVPAFGAYVNAPLSVCMAKRL